MQNKVKVKTAPYIPIAEARGFTAHSINKKIDSLSRVYFLFRCGLGHC